MVKIKKAIAELKGISNVTLGNIYKFTVDKNIIILRDSEIKDPFIFNDKKINEIVLSYDLNKNEAKKVTLKHVEYLGVSNFRSDDGIGVSSEGYIFKFHPSQVINEDDNETNLINHWVGLEKRIEKLENQTDTSEFANNIVKSLSNISVNNKVQEILDSTFKTSNQVLTGNLHNGESVLTSDDVVKEYSKVIDKLNESIKDFRKEVNEKLDGMDGVKLKKSVNSDGETVRISIDIDNKKVNGSELANTLIENIRKNGAKI